MLPGARIVAVRRDPLETCFSCYQFLYNNEYTRSFADLAAFWRAFDAAVRAMVTKRIKALTVDGRTVHTVGIPIHWGFTGVAKAGFLANSLTPVVGDGNSQTPEFKSFLVKVEKA